MEGEIINYIKLWLQVIPSLCYCFLIGKLLPPRGFLRLLAILPVVFFFLYLPLNLHSVHLGGTSAFFVAWLANFKLLLFAFGKGPLSDPSLSLKRFVALASFPIKIHENPSPESKQKAQNGTSPSDNSLTNGHTKSSNSHNNDQNRENPDNKLPDLPIKTRKKTQNGTIASKNSLTKGHSRSHSNYSQNRENPDEKSQKKGAKSLLIFAIKGLVLAGLVRSYRYREHFHPKLLLTFYCIHTYLCLEIILVMVAAMARTLIGVELEPQFNEPYLSSSLQDFWGRRWNIMVSKILRPTVYEPTYNAALRIMGRQWASLPAVFITFLVSGFIHELMFYYLGRVRPTWEITWFFLLHGFCLVMEIGFKRLTGRFRLARVVSGPLTVGFVMVTAIWLFFPQLLRCKGDERALEEYAAVGAFVRNISHSLTSKVSGSL